MALDDIKDSWQQQHLNAITNNREIAEIIRSRVDQTRKSIRRKLSADFLIYSFLVVLPLGQFVRTGFTVPNCASLTYGVLIYAILIGTSIYNERQLSKARVWPSLEESLKELIERVNSMERAYIVAYTIVVVFSIALLELLLGFSTFAGPSVTVISLVVGATLAIVMYFMVRLHLEQLLGRHRHRLIECLSELQRT